MFDVMQMLREQRQEEQQRQAMQEAHILVNGEMVSVRTLPTNFVRRLSVTSSRLTAPPPARTQVCCAWVREGGRGPFART